MCLYLEKGAEALKAEKDIICYKVFRRENDRLFSPYRDNEWLKNENGTYDVMESVMEVDQDEVSMGFHSICELQDAVEYLHINWKYSKDEHVIFKVVIPKGASYYVGTNKTSSGEQRGYTSTHIQVLEEVKQSDYPDVKKEVSICEKDGEKWVRVQYRDEDFLIGIHDYKEGGKDEFKWEEAIKIAEREGFGLFNIKQGTAMCMLYDEIQKAMVEAGGEELKGWYWSSARYYSTTAWFFNGNGGLLYYTYLSHGLSCRPLAYL